jgi:zinc protease
MDTMAQNITEKRVLENGRIFIAPTRNRDIVSFQGSILGGSLMLPKAQLEVPSFAGKLFDAGTAAHGKSVLRESLAARGASLRFSGGDRRTYFSGSCLPEDLQFLLEMVAECLGTATFLTPEIQSARERFLGSLKEDKTDTRIQAGHEMSRLLYDSAHPNYAEKDEYVEKSIKSVTRNEVVNFKNKLGRRGLVLAIVGGVEEGKALKAAERAFGKLKEGTFELPEIARNKKPVQVQEKLITIPQKANIDVYLGGFMPITYNDELYLPFAVVSDMLGGGFASHLMQTVRERDGLTYGVYSRSAGFDLGQEGDFRILATFSPLLYEKGVATTRKEIARFFASGLNEDALAKKKDEIIGSYVIGLATTRGLAARLHFIGTHNEELSYIDEYIEKIKAVTVADLHKTADLIPHKKLSLCAAGTFDKRP